MTPVDTGILIPMKVVHAALQWRVYLESLGLRDLDAFPGDSGEILLSAIHGSHSIDVIIEIDGTVSVAYDHDNVQQFYISHASENDARGYVTTLTMPDPANMKEVKQQCC